MKKCGFCQAPLPISSFRRKNGSEERFDDCKDCMALGGDYQAHKQKKEPPRTVICHKCHRQFQTEEVAKFLLCNECKESVDYQAANYGGVL